MVGSALGAVELPKVSTWTGSRVGSGCPMATGYRRESEATLGHLADVARWDDPEGRDAGAGSDDGPVLLIQLIYAVGGPRCGTGHSAGRYRE